MKPVVGAVKSAAETSRRRKGLKRFGVANDLARRGAQAEIVSSEDVLLWFSLGLWPMGREATLAAKNI